MGVEIKTANAFMRRILTGFIFFAASFILSGQKAQKGASAVKDLGLHGTVTWLSDTIIRVEYDWSDDSQLLDWTPTHGSTLGRGDQILTIENGSASVWSMIWKQTIKCSRIYAQDAMAINSPVAHLNFVTNVLEWTGYTFNPEDIIGLLYSANGNYWLENGTSSPLQAPALELGKKYTVDVNISDTAITSKSSSDNVLYSYNLSSPPENNRQVAVGGWGGNTQWGKLTIEGEISALPETPSDMINFQSCGAIFSPVIEVSGNPDIEWVFNDGSTSSLAAPSKQYGSTGLRNNYLRVTPWSALTGVNLGYDASDGGYGGFALVDNQQVLTIENLSLAKSSLQYFCASYNPLSELDIRGFSALKFIELLYCRNLMNLYLDSHPVLERLCVEGCNLASLDLSGLTGLKDLRGAENNYTSINWGSIGALLWHICVRSNPQFNVNIPALTQFPLLQELLIWDANQNGEFVVIATLFRELMQMIIIT